MAQRVEPHDSLDFFPTQPFATRALLDHVIKPMGWYDPRDTIWEPACGEGHMFRVLREYYEHVHASDVFDYGFGYHIFDFLTLEAGQLGIEPPVGPVDWIITNPPFGPASNPRLVRFATVALQHARKGIAMFGRIQMLEGEKRFTRIWRPWRAHAIYAQHVQRVPLAKGRILPPGETSATAYGWMLIYKAAPLPPTLPGCAVTAIPTLFIPSCRKDLEREGDYE